MLQDISLVLVLATRVCFFTKYHTSTIISWDGSSPFGPCHPKHEHPESTHLVQSCCVEDHVAFALILQSYSAHNSRYLVYSTHYSESLLLLVPFSFIFSFCFLRDSLLGAK